MGDNSPLQPLTNNSAKKPKNEVAELFSDIHKNGDGWIKSRIANNYRDLIRLKIIKTSTVLSSGNL